LIAWPALAIRHSKLADQVQILPPQQIGNLGIGCRRQEGSFSCAGTQHPIPAIG
jgi:hypothetical protein